MGDNILYCPLCCRKEFGSKKSLIEHLSSIVLPCPICDTKYTSIELLVEHLNCDNCEMIETIVKYSNKRELHSNVNRSKNDVEGSLTTASINFPSENNVAVNKLYIKLLSKQLKKPCVQPQQIKFLLKDGKKQYVVLTNNDSIGKLCTNNADVTKQNSDGSISLTTVKGVKTELNPSLTAAHDSLPKLKSEENASEMYSCNVCGISFSSVTDHIRNFHNHQDVVVEEPSDKVPSDNKLLIKSEIAESAEASSGRGITKERLPPGHMVTETGDTMKTSVILKYATDMSNPDTSEKEPSKSVDKGGMITKAKSNQKNKTSNGIENNANEKDKYKCLHCPASYENPKSLCAHMKVHKSQDIDFAPLVRLDFECAICGTVFPTRKALQLHKRIHDPIKSRPIEPPVQTKKGQVPSDDKYVCEICHKSIPVEYRAVHLNSHNNTNKIDCSVCNKKFDSETFLDMHMKVHKTDKVVVGKQDKSLPHNCTYCNRQFARPHEKVKHERIHTGEKPHSCEICGKSFRVAYCLTLHMRTHTGVRPYTCAHCGKRFKAQSVYSHHLLTHSEVRAFKCPFCPKAFKTSVQLASHKNSHTKPFSCQQCNRPFGTLNAVRQHMQCHEKQDLLKFSCRLCGASYARAVALNDHVRLAHNGHRNAADALPGLKEEVLEIEYDEMESEQPPYRDNNHEVYSTELDTNADELIIP